MLCTDRFSAGGHALVLRIQTGQWRWCAHTRSIEGRCAPEEISCPQQVEEGCSAFVIAPFLYRVAHDMHASCDPHWAESSPPSLCARVRVTTQRSTHFWLLGSWTLAMRVACLQASL